MEIEVHQRGGVLGLDRRYLVRDGTIEVIDKGQSHGSKGLDPKKAARIGELAASVATASVKPGSVLVSDEMETEVAILGKDGSKRLSIHAGDNAPPEVWDLIGEVSRASGGN